MLLWLTLLAFTWLSYANTYHGQICPNVIVSSSTTIRRGYLLSPRNFEFFSFAGVIGNTITISIRRTARAMDPTMELWSPAGVLYARADDEFSDPFGGPFGDPELAPTLLNETGTWVIAVADFAGQPTGPLQFTVVVRGSSVCCSTTSTRCLSDKLYASCDAGRPLGANLTCPQDQVCCPSGNNVYCVRPNECPYNNPNDACITVGEQRCVSSGSSYQTCATNIQGGTFFGVKQNCQPGYECCRSGINIYCVLPGQTC